MFTCRMCQGKNLYRFLDLGFTPPADQFKRKDQLKEPEIYYPLEVYMCEDCGLAQLGFVVSPEVLYRNDYPYESSITKTGRKHWASFAQGVVKRLGLKKKTWWLISEAMWGSFWKNSRTRACVSRGLTLRRTSS